MNSEISKILNLIEQQNQTRVLYAAALSAEASPQDVQFIYVRHCEHPDVAASLSVAQDGVRYTGWDLRQILQLIKTGDSSLLAWAKPAILYRADPVFALILGSLIREFCTEAGSDTVENFVFQEFCLAKAA